MDPQFHKLVQKQVRAARLYGKDSVENQQALCACQEWQDECHHVFRKHNRLVGPMCEKCNLPQETVEEREYKALHPDIESDHVVA